MLAVGLLTDDTSRLCLSFEINSRLQIMTVHRSRVLIDELMGAPQSNADQIENKTGRESVVQRYCK